MTGAGPAVLIMAEAPRGGSARRELEPLLGADGCAALQATLIVQSVSWARALAPTGLQIAFEPADSGDQLRPLVGDDAVLFAQRGEGITARVADASARVLASRDGPLLIAWPDLPSPREQTGVAVLGDLSAGCDLVLGPVVDGGLYLLAISRPLPELFALLDQAWGERGAMAVAVAAVQSAGIEIGILRVERALHAPADVRAALADPLLPREVAEVLRRAR